MAAEKIALGLDIRSGKSIEELDSILERMKNQVMNLRYSS